jgi:hypothetical protein
MRYATSTNSIVGVNRLVRMVLALLHANGPVDKHKGPDRVG